MEPQPVFLVPRPITADLDLQDRPLDHTGNVTTTSAERVPANKMRTTLWLINDSDTIIYLGIGRDAVLNQGIRLNANGGSLEINVYNLTKQAIYAIHGGSGNKVLLALEIESRYAH
jgi:hypothetical protein